MALPAGVVLRRGAVVVGVLNGGAVNSEKLRHRQVPFFGSPVHRCGPVVGRCGVGVCVVGKE